MTLQNYYVKTYFLSKKSYFTSNFELWVKIFLLCVNFLGGGGV